MAYQTEAADSWPENVYQVATTDPVLGGPDGPVNVLGAALATRSRYQRIRNVTPWDAALAYPEHAYCQLAGVTYKSLTANTNVQPGTPAATLVWTRWGFTQAELDAWFAAQSTGGGSVLVQSANFATTTNNAVTQTQLNNPSATRAMNCIVTASRLVDYGYSAYTDHHFYFSLTTTGFVAPTTLWTQYHNEMGFAGQKSSRSTMTRGILIPAGGSAYFSTKATQESGADPSVGMFVDHVMFGVPA